MIPYLVVFRSREMVEVTADNPEFARILAKAEQIKSGNTHRYQMQVLHYITGLFDINVEKERVREQRERIALYMAK